MASARAAARLSSCARSLWAAGPPLGQSGQTTEGWLYSTTSARLDPQNGHGRGSEPGAPRNSRLRGPVAGASVAVPVFVGSVRFILCGAAVRELDR